MEFFYDMPQGEKLVLQVPNTQVRAETCREVIRRLGAPYKSIDFLLDYGPRKVGIVVVESDYGRDQTGDYVFYVGQTDPHIIGGLIMFEPSFFTGPDAYDFWWTTCTIADLHALDMRGE
ncbi:hypothetical protein D3C78_1209040 [compost metagenome]